MTPQELIALLGCGVSFLAMWGTLYFRLGRLTSEVRGHNRMLAEIQKAIETILTR